MNSSFQYLQRYEKHITLKKIGISGQKKIFNSKILIIGMGGVGCPLLTYLAASGVGTIGIIDHDKVELSNLHRQTLFTTKDIGKFKVDQAKRKINQVNKRIKILSFKKKVTSKNIKNLLQKCDIICDELIIMILGI